MTVNLYIPGCNTRSFEPLVWRLCSFALCLTGTWIIRINRCSSFTVCCPTNLSLAVGQQPKAKNSLLLWFGPCSETWISANTRNNSRHRYAQKKTEINYDAFSTDENKTVLTDSSSEDSSSELSSSDEDSSCKMKIWNSTLNEDEWAYTEFTFSWASIVLQDTVDTTS